MHRPHARRVRARLGKLAGDGFYEYEDGKRAGLWSGLREAFGGRRPTTIPLEDLKERMLFIESIETVKCLDEGVIESVADANIGSILGHRLPRLDRRRAPVRQRLRAAASAGFVARARELAASYGERFEPPASLVEKAERGERYGDEQPALATA